MTAYAQTNIQLFNQLDRNGYLEADIARVRDAYVLAMRLFSGLYRSSGKTFIAHVTGTASVLAEIRAPGAVVAAALLHSAYSLGEFGTLRRKITARKRHRVRAAVGERVEELVAAYGSLVWNETTLRALRERGCTDAQERDVVLMRLANEVDDYGDLGALYTPAWQGRLAGARTFLPLCADVAERLDVSAIAEALRGVSRETLARSRPLMQSLTSPATSLVPPLSHAPRLRIRLRPYAARLREMLGGRFATKAR